MNAAQRIAAVSQVRKVLLHNGVVAHFRPGKAGESAAAGLLPTDAPLVGEMSAAAYEEYKEMILDRAKSLIIKCGISPVWVDGPSDPANGICSYDILAIDTNPEILEKKEADVINCYLAIMDGASAAAKALNEQFPAADKNQTTIAIVSQAFGLNPLDVEILPHPEWIRLLRYAKLCGAVKEAKST